MDEDIAMGIVLVVVFIAMVVLVSVLSHGIGYEAGWLEACTSLGHEYVEDRGCVEIQEAK